MPEIQSSALTASHEATCCNEESLFQSEMVKISVPKETSKRLPLKRAVCLAKKAARKRQSRLTFSQSTTVRSAQLVYWPYWLGMIQTEKDRPIFGPRRIIYYTIGDAVAGGHVVVKAMPDFEEYMVSSHLLVPFDQGIDAFQRELAIVQKEEIPKLFIFGPPKQKLEKVRLIYCPYWEVSFISKKEQALREVAYINAFNGSARTC